MLGHCHNLALRLGQRLEVRSRYRNKMEKLKWSLAGVQGVQYRRRRIQGRSWTWGFWRFIKTWASTEDFQPREWPDMMPFILGWLVAYKLECPHMPVLKSLWFSLLGLKPQQCHSIERSHV